ncbi:MAG: hypothetical protein IJV37_05450 [Bacteroidales bacterium]|nr:hypothetical protein [Bacteroidales bacterium]
MDFKPSIKTLGWLLVLLAMLGIGIISSAGAMNYGGIYLWAGIANLACWAFALYKLIRNLIKNGTI